MVADAMEICTAIIQNFLIRPNLIIFPIESRPTL